MGRPNKAGLDYFELDCLLDDNIRLIQAEFGLKGFAVVVKLYQKIYGSFGYYCEWNNDVLLLFVSDNGASGDGKNLINDIVTACIKRNIFSEKLFDKYGILTSSGIQKRYLNATSKREMVELKKEYLLISVDQNRKNVVINQVSDGINSINVGRNTQSRVEKSKEEKKELSVEKISTADVVCYLNHKAGTSYRNSTAKTKDLIKARVNDGFTIDDFKTVIDKKVDEWKGTDMEKYLRPETLFGPKFEGYLNQKAISKKNTNQFNDFNQRNYDFDELEKAAKK